MGVDQLCLYTSFTYMGTNHVVSGPNLCDFLLFRSKHQPNKMLDNWHIHKTIFCGCLGMQQIQLECNFIQCQKVVLHLLYVNQQLKVWGHPIKNKSCYVTTRSITSYSWTFMNWSRIAFQMLERAFNYENLFYIIFHQMSISKYEFGFWQRNI